MPGRRGRAGGVRGTFRIGSVLGIPVNINPSWFLLLILVVSMLATRVFPDVIGDQPAWVIWLLSFASVLVFFASLVLHELGHSVVARYFDIPVKSITLFVLGAVAQTARESRRPSHEFLMAAAGPAVSILLSGLFMVGWWVTGTGDSVLSQVCYWLWLTNFAVGIFNLIPAFPMDGGRLLRAMLWGITGNYRRSTRYAAFAGRGFAYALIGIGALVMLRVPGLFEEFSPLSGVQFLLLGVFLNMAARQGDMQSGVLEFLAGFRVSDVMLRDIPAEMSSTTVREALSGSLVGYGPSRDWLLVSDNGRFAGLASRMSLQTVPDERSDLIRVADVSIPTDRLTSVPPDETLNEVLQRMDADGMPVMMVVEDGQVSGLIHRGLVIGLMQGRREFGFG
jgi:Zn-dependent protease